MTLAAIEIGRDELRRVLGRYPTGVTVVTAQDHDGSILGMTVGSFTSVSLDPPLVAFLPQRNSSTFARIRELGRFFVNVLSADQEQVCRSFAVRQADRRTPLSGGCGDPAMLDGVVAWIDCTVEAVHEAGDHFIVVGRVRGLGEASAEAPLLFHRGGYGRFTPLSLVAAAERDILDRLRLADIARGCMEQLTADLQLECLAECLVDGSLVELASAGSTPDARGVTRVGLRLPCVPPLGACFMAWADPPAVNDWLSRSAIDRRDDDRSLHDRALARIRQDGYSITLQDPDLAEAEATVDLMAQSGEMEELRGRIRTLVSGLPGRHDESMLRIRSAIDHGVGAIEHSIRSITAPVRGADGEVLLCLTLRMPDGPQSVAFVKRCVDSLLIAAGRVSTAITRQPLT